MYKATFTCSLMIISIYIYIYFFIFFFLFFFFFLISYNLLDLKTAEEKFICIKIIEGNNEDSEKSLLGRNKNNIKNKDNEYNSVYDKTKERQIKGDIHKNNNSSDCGEMNIILNDSEVKYINFKGMVYEKKNIQINMINNFDRKVEVTTNVYHIYLNNRKKEIKKKENFDKDIYNLKHTKVEENNIHNNNNNNNNNSSIPFNANYDMYYECDACTNINNHLKAYINKDDINFQCVSLDKEKNIYIGKDNGNNKINFHFSPFFQGTYYCFLLFYVLCTKTKLLLSTCKINCVFYINYIKPEEVIKINYKSYNFTYDLILRPLNKQFLKSIYYILCKLNNSSNNVFFSIYIKRYLDNIYMNKENFFILCDSIKKVKIKDKKISFNNFNYTKYFKDDIINKNIDIDLLCDMIKRDVTYSCKLEINEEMNGVFEYNFYLLKGETIQCRKLFIHDKRWR